jgi:ATP-dependent DNA helicase DinG
VYFTGVADMAYRNKEKAWPKIAEGVEGVLLRHPGERVLVHTVSYELARYLHDYLGLSESLGDRNVVTYSSSREKDGALEQYIATAGSVLLAPSMDRGVDLPGDLCTVQVVAKVPYPNLKDKQINARMRMPHGQAWYTMRAIRSIVQMTGRGVRSSTDKAVTYILDEQFRTNIWAKSDHLFPEWWKAALRWDLKYKQLTKGIT